MAPFQGAALLAYNDGVFSERDLQSISRIGDSKKKEEEGKTGRFGVGEQPEGLQGGLGGLGRRKAREGQAGPGSDAQRVKKGFRAKGKRRSVDMVPEGKGCVCSGGAFAHCLLRHAWAVLLTGCGVWTLDTQRSM